MHAYSIDTDYRFRIYFILAFLSVSIASGLATFVSFVSIKIAAPSAMVIFLWLISVFDKYLWRLKYVNWIAGIPNIGGEWHGTLVRYGQSGDATTSREVTMHITQNWRTISIVMKGSHSKSNSTVACLQIANENDVVLKWVYFSHPMTGVQHVNLYGEGTTSLTLSRSVGALNFGGTYYSSKLQKGNLNLKQEV